MKYAGIGARKTPVQVLRVMGGIGRTMFEHGHTLRSGGAIGADEAFRAGVMDAQRLTWAQGKPIAGLEIYRPHHATPEAFDHAAKYHPKWEACDADAQALHARNSMILLGPQLNDPVTVVVCWTANGGIMGGTGQALRIAEAYNIPTFNLRHDPNAVQFCAWLVNNA